MRTKIQFAFILLLNAFIVLSIIPKDAFAIPSFARQTKLACNVCHTIFPELNAYGRQFKLNGYTLISVESVEAKSDSETTILRLPGNPPISSMIEAAYTYKNKEQPGTQNNNFSFPQQLSVFLAGSLTPKIGGFFQVTYDDQSGAFGIDNSDLRFADQTELASESFVYGLTLNNNPTVQDLWNSIPAWRFPFASSSTSPVPSAATLIEGGLAQNVLGLGVYSFWNNLLYTEVSLYKSALQGSHNPPDSTSNGVLKALAPYWRLALQQQFGDYNIELGTFGLSANQYPAGVSGISNKFTDVGIDANIEKPLGNNLITIHGSYIHQTLTPDSSSVNKNALNISNALNTFNVVGNLYLRSQIGFSIGYFSITGDNNPVLYSAASVTGSANGSPNSNGFIFEFDYLPWLNTKLAAQYVLYNKFNGGSTNYDGSGRNASDNNNLYLLCWVAF